MPHPNPNPNPNPYPKPNPNHNPIPNPILGFDTKSHSTVAMMKKAYNQMKICDDIVNIAKFGVKPKFDEPSTLYECLRCQVAKWTKNKDNTIRMACPRCKFFHKE